MNEAVYDRVRERVKEYNLSEQEIKAIETARQQLNTHTSLGGMTGGLVAYFLGKRKQFKPLQVFAVAAGGFLIGSQMGLVSGSLAGVKTIKQLPDPQRLVNLVRDVQKEMVQTRGQPLPRGPTPAPGAGAPGAPGPYGQQQQPSPNTTRDEFSMDDYNDYAKLESGFENDQALPPQHPQQQQEPSTSDSWANLQHEKSSSRHQESAWDKIRAQNAPDSAWAKLRMEAQKDPDALNQRKIAQARDEVAKSLQQRSQDSLEELPRTREETEHRGGSMRRNQWGDPIE